MRATILIAVLDSHEILRRQYFHWKKMNFPADVEILIMDDGSYPPLTFREMGLRNFRIVQTNNFQPWTQPEARNIGAKMARGEYLICTDIDHIITCGLVETVRKTAFDVVRFKREVAVLDENGDFTQDRAELTRWGFPAEGGLRISAHGNSYAIKRELFLELGGSQQKTVYPNRDEVKLKRGIKKLEAAGKITRIPDDDRPYIYMFPNGRYSGDIDCNPFGLFHNLKRGDAVYNNTRVEYA